MTKPNLEPFPGPSGPFGVPRPVRRQPLAQQVYDILFHRIITGELAEGTKLPSEHDLCAAFGISRPVVRHALEQLRADGLISSRRGSGSHVAHHSEAAGDVLSIEKIDQLLQNLEFRAIVEPEAAGLAALRRTERDLEALAKAIDLFEQVAIVEGGVGHQLDYAFQGAVASASANARIFEAVRSIQYDIDHGVNLACHLARLDHLERRKAVCAEHRRIFDGIRRQDADAARAAMRTHLEQARIRMMNRRPALPEP